MTDEQRKTFKLDDDIRAQHVARGEAVYFAVWPDGVREMRRVSDDSVLTHEERLNYQAQVDESRQDVRRQYSIRRKEHPFDISSDLMHSIADEVSEQNPFIWNDPREVK